MAGANHAGIGGEGGRFVGDGSLELFADVDEFIDFIVKAAKELAATDGRRRDEVAQDGKLGQGFAEGHEFAGSGLAEGDAAGEAFEVLNAAELLADFTADYCLLDEVRDGVEASFDGFAIEERAEEPGAEEASAHAGDRDVESGDERGGNILGGVVEKDGSEEFEIADGDGIEDQGVVLFVEADAIEVL
jgi:class 3 adenylate cyclase